MIEALQCYSPADRIVKSLFGEWNRPSLCQNMVDRMHALLRRCANAIEKLGDFKNVSLVYWKRHEELGNALCVRVYEVY